MVHVPFIHLRWPCCARGCSLTMKLRYTIDQTEELTKENFYISFSMKEA